MTFADIFAEPADSHSSDKVWDLSQKVIGILEFFRLATTILFFQSTAVFHTDDGAILR